MPLLSYVPGEHVLYKGRPATVRFTGQTLWCDDPMEWVGLELNGPQGKHDGVVDGTRYFNAQPQHGLFVRRLYLRPAGVHSELRLAQLAIHAQSPGLSPTMGLPPEENSRLILSRPGGVGSAISSPARASTSVLAAAEHERRRERELQREASLESGGTLDVRPLGGGSGRPALDVTLQAAQDALDASTSRRKELRRASSFGRSARGGGRSSSSALSASSTASLKGAASARRSAPASQPSPADDLSPPYRPYSPDAAHRRSCGSDWSRGSQGGDTLFPERGSTERGATERGSTERGSTERQSTERRSTERGSTERGGTAEPLEEPASPQASPRRESWATRYSAAQASRRESLGGAQSSAQRRSQEQACPDCGRTPPTAAGRPGSPEPGGSGRAEDAPRRDSWATRHAAALAARRLSSSPCREERGGGASMGKQHVAEWSDRETVKRIISGQWPPAELLG